MIVYVVICQEFFDRYICGIYRSKKKALFYRKKFEDEGCIFFRYVVESYEVIL